MIQLLCTTQINISETDYKLSIEIVIRMNVLEKWPFAINGQADFSLSLLLFLFLSVCVACAQARKLTIPIILLLHIENSLCLRACIVNMVFGVQRKQVIQCNRNE